jgi:hypothetical protein
MLTGLFIFSVVAAIVVFWLTFRVGREQRSIEEEIEALQASSPPR